jgi:pimeloyl-ACP methyl ester carboxylesterase
MNANATLETVASRDGTTIAYDRTGSGPAVVLICGGSTDRGSLAGLAGVLSATNTVYNVDRRGRGDSGDTLPYAIEREIEDIAAVIDASGGPAGLYGTSSGGALTLLAAASLGDRVRKLAIWEAPYFVDPALRPPLDTVEQYRKRLDAGHPEQAAEYFMSDVVRMPKEFVEFAKTQPFFAGQVKIAHTLVYDGLVMGDYLVPTEAAGRVTAPTLVIAGGADFPPMVDSARALAAAIPNGAFRHLEGQGHNVDPAVIGSVLAEFFIA